jgi:hypothetical protein
MEKMREKQATAEVEDEDSEDDGGDGVWGFILSPDGHADNTSGGGSGGW